MTGGEGLDAVGPDARDHTAGEADGEGARRWRRVRDLFNRALESAPAEREALLRRECGDDELRREVEALLEAYLDDERFLEVPAVAASGLVDAESPTLPESGTRIGRYRLLRLVGRGGMGEVYEAVRADRHFRKRVALKLVRVGMDSERILHRFRGERQILAQLTHPGIASLLDGGIAPDGRPYFVMEFVEGRPIDEYCDARRMGIRARVELFRDVCDAVQYAHQNLVVHRDLKPGNVLVTPAGRVKLLDFGIAKLLPEGATTGLTATETLGRMLTPAYASPEQVRGEPITTASDVYSLGVVLYELLAGRHPFSVRGSSLEEIVRVVCETEPIRPSAAVAEERTSPIVADARARTVGRRLEGDLDNVVLMALRKDPARRYASAAQLSEDLGRFLEGRPVAARKDAPAYRLKKFLGRHRVGVVAAAAVVLSLAGGVVATAVQARRAEAARAVAERRFQDTRDLTQALLFEVHDAIAELPGATAAREIVVRRGFEYLERLQAQSGEDPELRREVAEGWIRLGLVLGQPTGANLGDLAAARRSYRNALTVASELLEDDPGNAAARRTLAVAHEKLGDVASWSGDLDTGLVHARRALEIFTTLADARPESARARLSRAISHVKLGDLLGNPNFPNAGDAGGAEGEYRAALSLLGSPPLTADSSWGTRRYRGLVYERLGTMRRVSGDHRAARDAFARSLRIRTRLFEERPQNADARRDVAVTEQNLCEVLVALGEPEEGRRRCADALELYREAHALDPENVQAVGDLAVGYESSFNALRGAGEVSAALEALERAVSFRERAVAADPSNVPAAREHGRLLALLGRAYARAALDEDAGERRSEWTRRGREILVRARDVLVELEGRGVGVGAERSILREGAQALGELGLDVSRTLAAGGSRAP